MGQMKGGKIGKWNVAQKAQEREKNAWKKKKKRKHITEISAYIATYGFHTILTVVSYWISTTVL